MGDIVFNQQNQNVKNQTNIGSINFGAVNDAGDLKKELEKLRQAITNAVEEKLLDPDAGADATMNVTKAINQTNDESPDKNKLLEYLQTAENIVGGVSGLSAAVGAAITAIGALF